MLKPFQITSICRYDIKEHFRDQAGKNPNFDQLVAKARLLTDKDMTRIAEKMANDYLEQMFWTSLDIIVQDYLETKEVPK